MNDEEFLNQYGQEAINPPNYFESPENIARHILEHEESESGVVNADSPRANLNPLEMRAVRVCGDMISELAYAERLCGWNLSEAKAYMIEKLATTNVPSRSKDGFAVVLTKTDKRVNTSELTNYAGEISQHFNEETEDGLFSKLPLIGGAFKKKQDGAING